MLGNRGNFIEGTLQGGIGAVTELRVISATISDEKVVPEPSSTLSLLALGTLSAASTLKRKLKASKCTEKELEKVG